MPVFKIITAPEGEPTFVDESTGAERPLLRITELSSESEKMAVKHVEAQMWAIHVEKGEPLYEVVSVEIISED
jgi:hypothetical protein